MYLFRFWTNLIIIIYMRDINKDMGNDF